jgi:hypothetical protein
VQVPQFDLAFLDRNIFACREKEVNQCKYRNSILLFSTETFLLVEKKKSISASTAKPPVDRDQASEPIDISNR